MWVQVSTWVVQDDYRELGVGDPGKTVLDACLPDDVEEVDSSTPLSLILADEPLFNIGPAYDIVGRMVEDEAVGDYLDTGSAQLIPRRSRSWRQWPSRTVLRFRSELSGGWYEADPTPDILLFSGVIRRLLVRWSQAVPGDYPNSYRADPSTVRFRSIERMSPWEDEKNPDGDGEVISDYLVELS